MARGDPIGIFDSGVGGLSIVLEVRRLLPHEDLIYFADTANFPYGERSPGQLRGLALKAATFLLTKQVKLIVVACNTASSAALRTLRDSFRVPFVGMVPAIKPASIATRTGKVGVIATPATVQAEVFSDLVTQFANGVTVFTRACPSLAELVEKGETDSPALRQLLHHHLDPMLAEGIDTLVLGCTHYPFLRAVIEEIVGQEVKVIDSGAAVARQVERVLQAQNLICQRRRLGKVSCFTSGDRSSFSAKVKRLCPGLYADEEC